MYRLQLGLRTLTLARLPHSLAPTSAPTSTSTLRALSTTPRLLSKTHPNPDSPVPESEDSVDPAARGVNEMRRQWGGLIDGAEADLAEERAATKAARKIKKDAQDEAAERGEIRREEKKDRVKVDLSKHEGLEADVEPTVDPAARGVNEMRRQWGGLIDEKNR